MIADFIDPLEVTDFIDEKKPLDANQLGSKVAFNTTNKFDDNDYQLAIIGVPEDRATTDNHGCATGLLHIRKELYKLFVHDELPKILDLGNLKVGHSIKDTQVALETLLAELLEQRIVAIIIGGGHDLTFGQYQAYKGRMHKTDLAIIDEKIDINETTEVTSGSFLWHILNQDPSHLFGCSHFGHQLFYNNPKHIDYLQSLNYDVMRLGEMRTDLLEIEPYLRNADLISFDISAIRSSDAPANAVTSPNGLGGEEACQLCRYAGFSNKVTSFGLYEFNPYFDQNNQGAKQVSQMLWYFIEGFGKRKADDFPSEDHQNFVKYMVHLESTEHELIFWKSTYSNKWWMEIPQKDEEHPKFLPCSYRDYQNAMEDELPDRWMKVYAQLN